LPKLNVKKVKHAGGAPRWQPSSDGSSTDSILQQAAAARAAARLAAAAATAKADVSGFQVQAHAALDVSAQNRLVLVVRMAINIQGADYSHSPWPAHFSHAVASCALLSADRVQVGSYYNAAQQTTQVGAALHIAQDYCTVNGDQYCYPAATPSSENEVFFARKLWGTAFSQCLYSTLRTTEKVPSLSFGGVGNGPALTVSPPKISLKWQTPKYAAAERQRVAAAAKRQQVAAGLLGGMSAIEMVLLFCIMVLWFSMAYYFHSRYNGERGTAPMAGEMAEQKTFAKSSSSGRARVANDAASRLSDGIGRAKQEQEQQIDPTKAVVSYGGYGGEGERMSGGGAGRGQGKYGDYVVDDDDIDASGQNRFAKTVVATSTETTSYGYQQDEKFIEEDDGDDDLV
jgi:hypothetical protein